MQTEDVLRPVVVFAGTYWQAGILISMLENAEIQAFLFDGARGSYNPGWNLAGEEGSVRVVVSLRDLEQAKIIVEEYKENLKSD